MPVSTGSDTRMYAPRSESNLGYTKDPDDNPHGIGDPETMEQMRDKRMLEQERQQTISDLPHLQLDVPNPNPTPPPPPPEMPEEPAMDDDNENARGAEISQLTGMPDTGNLSMGAATGTMPAPGGMLATGEPMDDAWSSLLKTRDPAAEGRPHSSFDLMNITPGGYHTTPSEEDIRRFTENNPDIRRTHKYQQFDRFPDYRKPTRFGGGRKGDPRTTHHFEEGDPMEFDDDLEVSGQLAIARRQDVSKPHHERKYFESALPEGHRAGGWTSLPALREGREIRGQPGGTYWAHRGAEDDEQPQEMPEWFGDSEYKTTGEPISDAWSSLMKARKNLKNMGRSKSRAWKQPQYKIQPGGSDISTATPRRSKLYSRHLQPAKHRGIDSAPLSVHRTHLGVATKQPLKLFPRDYGQQTGSMQRRKWQGNIPSGHPSGHAMGPETTYSPKTRSTASSAGLKIRAPSGPKLRGQNMGIKNTLKSEDIAGIKKDLSLIEKKMSYMHFAQMRRLMRKVKEALADKERRLKGRVSSGPGEKGKAGHMEGQDKTTRPTGATESLDIPDSWGAPSTLFAAPGSGRVG